MPDAPMNLLSIGRLESLGFYLNNRQRVLENGKQFIAIQKLGNLYHVPCRVLTGNGTVNLTLQSSRNTAAPFKDVHKINIAVDKSDWKLIP